MRLKLHDWNEGSELMPTGEVEVDVLPRKGDRIRIKRPDGNDHYKFVTMVEHVLDDGKLVPHAIHIQYGG